MPNLMRIQAAAHLYGVSAPDPVSARVLAIGHGWEGLLAWVSVFEDMHLALVLDTEQEAATALAEAGRLGCGKVTICTLADLGELTGPFDYIIAHRLYSRLPAAASEQLLQLCSALLDEQGVACVDYDVHPGGKLLENVFAFINLHIHGIDTPEQAADAARGALSFLEQGAQGETCTAAMRDAVRQVRTELDLNGAQALWSERLGPCHFLEFALAAESAGLGCVGDIEPMRDVPRLFGTQVALNHSLHTLGKPALMRQQYLDFSTGRWRRATLLAKRPTLPSLTPDLDRLESLSWAACFERQVGTSIAEGCASFIDARARVLDSTAPVLTSLLDTLSLAWPSAVNLESIENALRVSLARQEISGEGLRQSILDTLQDLMARDLVEYSLGSGPYDHLTARDACLLPGMADALTQDAAVGMQHPIINLWGQEVKLRFPQADKALLLVLEQQFGVDPDEGGQTGVYDGQKFVLRDASKERQRRVSMLNWNGLMLAEASAWQDALQSILQDSEGWAPYWVEYIAALARKSMQPDPHSGTIAFQPTPQLRQRLEGLRRRITEFAQYREVEPQVRQLLASTPDWVPAVHLLCHCLIEMGEAREALGLLVGTLATEPRNAQNYLMVAAAMSTLPRQSEAIVSARRALALEPGLTKAYLALGNTLKAERRAKEAELNYRMAMDCDPEDAASFTNLASVLLDMGLIEDAIEVCQTGLEKHPMVAGMTSNLLFGINYSARSAEEIYAVYQRAEQRAFSTVRSAWKAHRNSRNTKRRLKVGYISPDFRNHAVARFLEPLMQHHDHQQFHITSYADIFSEDAYTERFKGYSDVWRNITGMSTTALVDRIREDEIDVLIDVAGHTAHNRLAVFARKPAPVSMTWLGFGYTTGLEAIDYILMDPEMAPEGSEGLFSETPWRLPGTPFVLRMPPQAEIPVGELPALKNGYVRFGSLTRAIRVNPGVVGAWAAILKRVPGSKLVLDSSNFDDAWTVQRVQGMFAEHGIEAARLELGYHSPPWGLLNNLDIGLDCFPHNSGTTLMEMLYMGLPYVTVRSRPSVGRLGASILRSINRPEWIADSPEEYVDILVGLASDLPALAEIRANLRQDMKNSRLMNEENFTREIEEAYIGMFGKWVAKKKG